MHLKFYKTYQLIKTNFIQYIIYLSYLRWKLAVFISDKIGYSFTNAETFKGR